MNQDCGDAKDQSLVSSSGESCDKYGCILDQGVEFILTRMADAPVVECGQVLIQVGIVFVEKVVVERMTKEKPNQAMETVGKANDGFRDGFSKNPQQMN